MTAVALLVVAPGLAQDAESEPFAYPAGSRGEPRCIDCHVPKDEPWPAVVTLQVPKQVKAGEPFEVKLTVLNQWTQPARPTLYQTMFGAIDISKAPGVVFPSGKEPFHSEAADRVGVRTPTTTPARDIPFAVEAEATEIVVTVRGEPGPGNLNDLELELIPPSEAPIYKNGPDTGQNNNSHIETVTVPYAAIVAQNPGEWKARVTAPRGVGTELPFSISIDVYYNGSSVPQKFLRGPDTLEAGVPYTYTFQLIAGDKGTGEIVAASILDQFYEHSSGQEQDIATFQDVRTAPLVVGDTYIPPDDIALPDALSGTNWAEVKALSEIIGYGSTFVLIPSLVMGGTFGKGSVTFFNRVLGAARRRVLWHNSMSFMLLGLSILHMVLFLLEPRYRWDIGLLWGGLSLACMIGLGITGAMQRKLVKDWGFGTWRFVHFGLGVLVVGFVLLHLFLDGAHFEDLRKALGT